MTDSHMIPIDTEENCPRCGHITTHSWRVNRDIIYSRCQECGMESSAAVRDVSSLLRRLDEYSRVHKKLEGISDQLNLLGGEVLSHKWSANIGKKDRSFIERLIAHILHIKGDVDKI